MFMRDGMRPRIIAIALSLSAAGCASEEWTNNLLSKRQAQVDERFTEQGQRIDRVEGRVAHLEVTLTETRDQVRDVLAAPPTVPARRPPGLSGPDRAAVPARTLVAIIHVLFGFDRADLDANAQAALASIVKQLREHPNITIHLEGMTDPVGKLDYNIRLSQRRISTVQRWLTEKGVDRTRIVGSTSRGPVADPSVKDSAKRRVMVKLMETQ
jgi:outer membrane protein OmpA-like peptidoglycan-associated protein